MSDVGEPDFIAQAANVVALSCQLGIALLTYAKRDRFRSRLSWWLILLFVMGCAMGTSLTLAGTQGGILRAASWLAFVVGLLIHLSHLDDERRSDA